MLRFTILTFLLLNIGYSSTFTNVRSDIDTSECNIVKNRGHIRALNTIDKRLHIVTENGKHLSILQKHLKTNTKAELTLSGNQSDLKNKWNQHKDADKYLFFLIKDPVTINPTVGFMNKSNACFNVYDLKTNESKEVKCKCIDIGKVQPIKFFINEVEGSSFWGVQEKDKKLCNVAKFTLDNNSMIQCNEKYDSKDSCFGSVTSTLSTPITGIQQKDGTRLIISNTFLIFKKSSMSPQKEGKRSDFIICLDGTDSARITSQAVIAIMLISCVAGGAYWGWHRYCRKRCTQSAASKKPGTRSKIDDNRKSSASQGTVSIGTMVTTPFSIAPPNSSSTAQNTATMYPIMPPSSAAKTSSPTKGPLATRPQVSQTSTPSITNTPSPRTSIMNTLSLHSRNVFAIRARSKKLKSRFNMSPLSKMIKPTLNKSRVSKRTSKVTPKVTRKVVQKKAKKAKNSKASKKPKPNGGDKKK